MSRCCKIPAPHFTTINPQQFFAGDVFPEFIPEFDTNGLIVQVMGGNFQMAQTGKLILTHDFDPAFNALPLFFEHVHKEDINLQVRAFGGHLGVHGGRRRGGEWGAWNRDIQSPENNIGACAQEVEVIPTCGVAEAPEEHRPHRRYLVPVVLENGFRAFGNHLSRYPFGNPIYAHSISNCNPYAKCIQFTSAGTCKLY